MALTPGTRLGTYEVVALLRVGGMGEVYRAFDSKLERYVAIKVLPTELVENGAALARFEREAKAIAALSHPNILSIFDFARDGTTVFAVMELRIHAERGSGPSLLFCPRHVTSQPTPD